MIKKYLSIILSVFVLTSCISVYADEEELPEVISESFGMAVMTDEQIQEFNSSLPYITGVRPNRVALERLNNTSSMFSLLNAEDSQETADLGDEIICRYPGSSGGGSGSASSSFELPSSVDITESLTFPAIGNQGSYNSCVAWAMAYYQLTNNTCLVRGTNARNVNGTNILSNVFNPLWTYSMINGGSNYGAGTYYYEALASIMSFGVPTYSDFATGFNSSSIQAWNTDTAAWNNAIRNKPLEVSYSYINTSSTVGINDPSIKKLKSILSDGYVVTIPTVYNSFVWTTRTTESRYACKYAKYVAEKEREGHALTVVGYDDNFWVDVNNNRVQDEGELGAFKIANSWGLNGSYCNSGCFWIAYDALGSESNVDNAPISNRVPAFEYYYLIQPKAEYTPLMIANVQITASDRNQIGLAIGISDENDNVPDKKLSVTNDFYIAFGEANKSFLNHYSDISIPKRNFNGSTSLSAQTITVPFDITPVIKNLYSQTGLAGMDKIKVYVTLTDNINDGYQTKLKNLSVTDVPSGAVFYTDDGSVKTVDNSSATKTVLCDLSAYVGTYLNQNLTVNFNSNVSPETVSDQNFHLIDNKDSIVNLNYSISESRIMSASPDTPDGKYVTDSVYRLFIGDSIASAGKNRLKADREIPIYMLGRYYEWKNYDVY